MKIKLIMRRIILLCFISLTGLALALSFAAPGVAATAPSVSTVAVADITSNSAKLTGSLDSLGTASSVNVSFEYGRTAGYGTTTSTQPMTGTGNFSINIAGLSSNATYHFRAKADGGTQGISYGSDVTFTTLNPPIVTTGQAQYITANTVTLKGNLTGLGSSSSVNVYFQYGTSTSYGMTSSSLSKTGTTEFSIDVTGLTPGTVYHFRAMADGGMNGITAGADATFLTTPTPPSVTTVSATSVTYTLATVRGNLLYMGTATSVGVSFEYGTTSSYGSSSSVQSLTAAGSVSANLTNLTPGTVYHYRTKADGGIHGIGTGSDMTFTTQPANPPQLSLASSKDVSYSTVTLVGNLASMGTAPSVAVSFEYGTTTGYGSSIAATDYSGGIGTKGGFHADLTGLQTGTIYHFRAKADGGLHGVAYSDDSTFTTLGTGSVPLPVVATSGADSITFSSATVSGNLTSMGATSSIGVYFEYGTSTNFGSKTSQQVVKAPSTFTANLTGLAPGKLYHYRAVADDGIQYRVAGNDMTFTTPSVSPEVTTKGVSDITDTGAVLNGNLVSLGTTDSVKVFFEYGISAFYGKSTTAQSTAVPGSFSASVIGLKPGTEYHYRIKADGGPNGIITGEDMSFTTLGQSLVTIDSSSLVINPTTASTGDSVNISVSANNTSNTVATYKLELLINGISTETKQIELQPGAKQQVTFTVVENTAGTYQFSINGISGSFIVTEKQETTTPGVPQTTTTGKQTLSSQLFLFIALGVVVLVGLAIFLVRRFERRS